MRVYSGEGLGDMYYQIIRDLAEQGRRITTRGHECLEFKEPVTLEYRQPGACWMRIPGRKWNPFLAMAEVFWILAGSGNVEEIAYFSNFIRNFQDDKNPDFHGAYGLRIRKWEYEVGEVIHYLDQIQHVVRKLQVDPQSRQAVISLWDPVGDNIIVSKDYPCNNMVYYSLRDGILDQTVVMRSNDLIWGTTYNAVQFTHLHALVAGMLGVEMGKFTYVIQNLHYYMNLYPQILSRVIDEAHTGQPIHALYRESFDTVDDPRFIEAAWAGVCDMQTSTEINWAAYFDGCKMPEGEINGWLLRYFRALALFCYMKRDKGPMYGPTVSIESLHALLYSIGEPIKSLILDFWADSKNLRIQELVKSCQRTSTLSV